MPVATDVEEVQRLLRRGDVRAAVAGLRRRPAARHRLAGPRRRWATTSPSSVREALLAHPDPDAVLRYSELAPYDTAVVEACLAALPVHHPVAPLLKGKLASAR